MFPKYLVPVNTLIAEECSETGVFGNSSNHIKISEKRLLVLKIIAFDLVPATSVNSDEKTCVRLLTCCKTDLRFQI